MTKHSTLFESGARVRHIVLHWLGTVVNKPWGENQSVKIQVDGADLPEYFRKVDLIVVPDDEKAPAVKPPAAVIAFKAPPPLPAAKTKPVATEPSRSLIQQLIDQAEEKLYKAKREIFQLEEKIATLKDVRKEMNALS